MIVDPDFFDHWKTLLLIEELDGDAAAPIYILRLWAHCQRERSVILAKHDCERLDCICRFNGRASRLLSAMVESDFLSINENGIVNVSSFVTYNAKLIELWENPLFGSDRPDLRTNEWKKIRDQVISENGTRCHYCATDCSDDPTVDHVKPASKGGTHARSNLVVACRSCNARKGNREDGW